MILDLDTINLLKTEYEYNLNSWIEISKHLLNNYANTIEELTLEKINDLLVNEKIDEPINYYDFKTYYRLAKELYKICPYTIGLKTKYDYLTRKGGVIIFNQHQLKTLTKDQLLKLAIAFYKFCPEPQNYRFNWNLNWKQNVDFKNINYDPLLKDIPCKIDLTIWNEIILDEKEIIIDSKYNLDQCAMSITKLSLFTIKLYYKQFIEGRNLYYVWWT